MRKLITLLTLALLSCHKEEAPIPEPLEATPTKTLVNGVSYFGRWNSNHTYSGWGGAYLKFRFTGTAKITVSDQSLNYYWTILDGQSAVKHVVTSQSSFTVTKSGTHELIVAQGKDYHYSFNLTRIEGNISPATTGKLVEWIGDSITAGYFTTKADVTDYAWIVSEALGVEHTQIAYPGITLYHGMDKQYGMTSCTGNTEWVKSYVPNVIVINLGTNDQNKHVSDSDFKASYEDLVEKLKGMYPNVKILLLRPFNGAKAVVVKQVADEYGNVMYVDTQGWLTKVNTVDNLHPNDEGNRIIAKLLEPILKKYL